MIDLNTAKVYYSRLFLRAFSLRLFPEAQRLGRSYVVQCMLDLGSAELLQMHDHTDKILSDLPRHDPAHHVFHSSAEKLMVAYTELADLEEYMKAHPDFLSSVADNVPS